MAPHGTLLVLGSGPGIGVHVAQLFAERGFRQVILASRDASRLQKEVEDVKKVGGESVSGSYNPAGPSMVTLTTCCFIYR